jgi:hypothetical protein
VPNVVAGKPWHRDPGGPLSAIVRWPYELAPILTVAWTDPPCACGHPFSDHFWRCQCGSIKFCRAGYAPDEMFTECDECDALRPEWPTRCKYCPCDGFIVIRRGLD